MNELREAAEMAVHLLLDATGDTVEIEYRPMSIDSMPHTAWMIRAVGSDPTQYLAKGTAHTPEEAKRQADEKVRLLGVRVSNPQTQRRP